MSSLSSKRVVAIIPARMASSRFPGKPLTQISGLPMIEHVRRRALLTPGLAGVVVATCDEEIIRAVESYGGAAVMTSDQHERCTARVSEAASKVDGEVFVVVQGDEPLLLPESISEAAAPLCAATEFDCVSLLSPLEGDADYANPNIVKAACAQNGRLLFLSRSPIPYFMNRRQVPVYRETGIRALTRSALDRYWTLPPTPLEEAESVDVLRLLEHGYSICGVKTEYATMGVDHVEDVTAVERALQHDPRQRALFEMIR